MKIIVNWLILTIAIIVAAYFVPGVYVEGFTTALWSALVLGIINTLIKPLLIFLTLPINILTLGLFTFIINAILVMMAAAIVAGFNITGFWTAIIFSIAISIVVYILNLIFKEE